MLPLMTGRGGLLGAETESALRNFLLEFKMSVIDFFNFTAPAIFAIFTWRRRGVSIWRLMCLVLGRKLGFVWFDKTIR